MAQQYMNCPYCKQTLSGEEDWKGMTLECPYCKQEFQWLTSVPAENQCICKSLADGGTIGKGLLVSAILSGVSLLCDLIGRLWIFILELKRVDSMYTNGKYDHDKIMKFYNEYRELQTFLYHSTSINTSLYNIFLLMLVVFAMSYISNKQCSSNIALIQQQSTSAFRSAIVSGIVIVVSTLVRIGYGIICWHITQNKVKLDEPSYLYPIGNFISSLMYIAFWVSLAFLIINVSKYLKYKRDLQS